MMRRLAFLALAIVGLGAAHVVAAEQPNVLGFQSNSSVPIVVNADSLEVLDQGDQRISTFSGKVLVTQGPTVMKAETMKLFSSLQSGSDSDFTRIEADGGIWYNSGDQIVTGDRAVVDNLAHTVTVYGNVVFTQNQSVITGSQLVVDMTTGRAKIVQDPGKQIQGVFTPNAAKKAPDGGGN